MIPAADHALARARTYGWLAEVLLDGWTVRARGVASALPGWDAVTACSPDDLAARHHGALGRGVAPYASVFRDADGRLGGPEAAWWADWHRRIGAPDRADTEPDHAGRIAAGLAWLEGARHEALADGVSDAPMRILASEALARTGFVRWVAVAVRSQEVSEVADLLDLLWELLHEHGSAEGVPGEPVDVLARAEAGLADLAAHLLIPARAGLWVGPDDLRRLSARCGAPCGFGRRPQMAESLVFSAADHGLLGALADAVDAEIARWDGVLGPDPRRGATAAAFRTLASAAPAPRRVDPSASGE